MRLKALAGVILLAFPALGSGVLADAPADHRRVRAAPPRLAPEVRYRDPRYASPSRRPALRFAGPRILVEGYLPRYTDAPMYNKPPSRFPKY